jgi:lipopolysaccharide export system protein LptA
MKHRFGIGILAILALAASLPALAQVGGLKKDTPIQISSDTLDVLQPQQKAIFKGNVIAVQGTTTMRSAEMTVFYRESGEAAAAPSAATATPPAQGIYRIEAEGSVVFTTPTETALGDKAIYNVDTDTIDVMGANVTLTRGQNILKGTKLNYNMATGRSVLTGGVTGTTANGGKPARVHGLFVPKSEPKAAAKP